MKLGISSEDLHNPILTRLDFKKGYQSAVKPPVTQIQNWGWNAPWTNLGEKTSLVFLFVFIVQCFYYSDFSFHSQSWERKKWGPVPPQFGIHYP
jgi:hypothetical protein